MKRIIPWIAAILTVIVWAETFVSTKILLDQGLLPPDIFIFRFILAYCGIWLLCFLGKDQKNITVFPVKSPSRDRLIDELRFMALGVFGGSLYFLCENTALEYSTASNVAILVGSAPLLTGMLVGIVYRDERLSKRQWLGSVTAFIGMVMVVLNGELVLHLNPKGDSLALMAAMVWALYSLIIRKVSGRYNNLFVTRKIFGYGLVTMKIPEGFNFDPSIMCRHVVWGNLLYLGIVASLICFIAWNYALKELGTTRTTNIIYGQSFITMIIAAMVLGERITLMAIAGAFVLVFGTILAVRK